MLQKTERTFLCPNLDSQEMAITVRQALADTPGALDFSVSLADRTVAVTLANPQDEAIIRRHLSAAGCPPED